MKRLVFYLWASPNSLLGLLLAILSLPGGHCQCRDGVVEASGGWLARVLRGRVLAITLGHVVLARSARDLEQWRVHERVHVRQYEQLGPFFLPVYLALGMWTAMCGRHPYRDHPLERAARR